MLLLPLTSAFLGWLIVTLSLTLLFRPRKSIHLGPWLLQGILPRYRPQLQASISELASEELISSATIVEKIQKVNIQDEVAKMLATRIDVVLNKFAQKNPMLGMFVNDALKAEIRSLVVAEIIGELPTLQAALAHKIVDQFDIKGLLQQKINKLDLDHMEQQIAKAACKHSRPLQLFAVVIGFCFGLFQAALV